MAKDQKKGTTPAGTPEGAVKSATPGDAQGGTSQPGGQAGGRETGTRNRRKTRVGVVTGDRMEKTVTVTVERRFPHPLYGKQVTRTKRYHAHDEKDEYHIG